MKPDSSVLRVIPLATIILPLPADCKVRLGLLQLQQTLRRLPPRCTPLPDSPARHPTTCNYSDDLEPPPPEPPRSNRSENRSADILIATSRPRLGPRARQTSPMPPLPMGARIS